MKKGEIIFLVMIVFCICGLSNFSYAQTENSTLAKEERSVGTFNTIVAGEIFIITYTPSEAYKVIVETNKNKLEQITTETNNGVLNIKNNSLRSPGVLNIFIYAPFLTEVRLSGAAEFYSENVMNTESIKIETTGAAKAEMNIRSKQVYLNIQGASELVLQGNAEFMEANVDGTAMLDATNLVAKNASIASRSKTISTINVTDTLKITSYSTSKIVYNGEPKTITKNNIIDQNDHSRKAFNNNHQYEEDFNSRPRSGFGRINVSVKDRGDSTIVVLGRHQFLIDEYGNARYRKLYRKKFNGHWGGFDLGINGYLTPNFDMDFQDGYDFLDLNLGKSTRVDLNIFEQNLPISKDNHWGFVTGVGFEFRNYRFDKSITLIPDEDEIIGYTNSGISTKKSKLTAYYINIPFIFEYQTNSYNERNSFHISAGMVFGLRYASKTKRVFDSKNTPFDLIDAQGNIVETITYDKKKVKEHDSFHLNPIKIDAMLRFGWGWLNFYASYSVTKMFKKDEGPELYPFSVGMTLLKW